MQPKVVAGILPKPTSWVYKINNRPPLKNTYGMRQVKAFSTVQNTTKEVRSAYRKTKENCRRTEETVAGKTGGKLSPDGEILTVIGSEDS